MDVFEILEEDTNCDLDILKSKCQKIIKMKHPDKNGGKESQDFLEIMKVWHILNDPKLFEVARSKTKHKPNWDTLDLSEMNYDAQNDAYTRDCRCGDEYLLPKEEIEDSSEICVECDTCSNTITVKT